MPQSTSRHPQTPSTASAKRERDPRHTAGHVRAGRYVVEHRPRSGGIPTGAVIRYGESAPVPKPQAYAVRAALIAEDGLPEQEVRVVMHESDPLYPEVMDAVAILWEQSARDARAAADRQHAMFAARLPIIVENEVVEPATAAHDIPEEGRNQPRKADSDRAAAEGTATERTASNRLRTLRRNPAPESRWEALRRLLHVRGLALAEVLELGDVKAARARWEWMRPTYIRMVSDGWRSSSKQASEDELGTAIEIIEGELMDHGFDFDAADAAYAEREAERLKAYGYDE
ncbi:MAG: hypothetical protein AAFQ53_14935, partial [Bacteroidota bacterium]